MSNKNDVSIRDTLELTISLPYVPDVSQNYYFYLSGCNFYIKACFDKVPNLLIELVNENSSKHCSGIWSANVNVNVNAQNRFNKTKKLVLIGRPLHVKMKNYIENIHHYLCSTTVYIQINIAIDKANDTFHYNHSVLSDVKRHYDTISTTADVYIIAESTNSENIPAHKAILTVRSPVFKAMFESNMSESSSNQVQISDFDAVTIRRMVEFMYKDTFTGIKSTSYEDLISLLAISNKYQVLNLKKVTEKYVIKMLSANNVSELTHNAILYDASDLLKACLLFL